MGLRTLASGKTKGPQTLYQAPLGNWASITRLRLVNESGADAPLALRLHSTGKDSLLTPSGFIFKAGYKLELDDIAMDPQGKLTLDSASGISFTIVGEERNSA